MPLELGIRTVLAIAVLAALADADLELAGMFGDNMVLQRGSEITIWGRDLPGQLVKISIAGRIVSSQTGLEGRWKATTGPFEAIESTTVVIEGSSRIVLGDVSVGDVWVCSGQSNMTWPVRLSMDPDTTLRQCSDAGLRLFTVRRRVSATVCEDLGGNWRTSKPDTVADFSAVAYYFGRELRRRLNVPIGLIHSSWGGTPAVAWASQETLRGNPDFQVLMDRWREVIDRWPDKRDRYERLLEAWRREVAEARASGRTPPRRPREPRGPLHPHRPSGLFNGMIAPLTGFTIKGVIWYQGEADTGKALLYRQLFPSLIRGWRSAWDQGDFPFLFVQLANYRKPSLEPMESNWAELREAQRLALRVPNTAMTVAIDIGEQGDIHPENKQEVGRRLALAARAIAYGEKDLVYSGPIYSGHTVTGSCIVIRFAQIGGGLRTRDGGELCGFLIAGREGPWVRAIARIEGDSVVVWNPAVRMPVRVRYAWATNPVCNLINAEGLPASPFCTDGPAVSPAPED